MIRLKALLLSVVLPLAMCAIVLAHARPTKSDPLKGQMEARIGTRATATNGILSITYSESTGQYAIRTGAQHPHPNETVFYGSGGTSYFTLRDATDLKMLTNGGVSNAGLAGYTTGSLGTGTTTALGTTGFRTTFVVAGKWQVEQEVVITGSSLDDTAVRQSEKVTNISNAPRLCGMRYQWDWQIAGNDASLFRTRQPDGAFTSTFQTFVNPQFRLFEEVDSATDPTFSVFGSVRDLPLNPPPTTPDQLRYCSWGAAVSSAWDFTNTGGGSDSSVCHYWGFDNPISVAPNASTTFTQYVTTQFEAIARPGFQVSKTAPATVTAGSTLTYTFTVRNEGDAVATNVRLTDTLPTGTTFISATGGTGVSVSNGVFSMNLSDIAPDSQVTATMTVRVPSTLTGNVVNQTYSVTATGANTANGASVTTQIVGAPTPTPTFTPTPKPTATPTLPPPGPLTGRIVFSSSRDGNNEIDVMNADGTSQTRLTSNAAIDDMPHLSRDGRRIVFSSRRDGNRNIYLMNVDGTNPVRLTTNAAIDQQPQFSPDGTKITFVSTRDGGPEIYIMDSDGNNQTRLTVNATQDDYPSFSPNGERIVFHSYRNNNHDIFVMRSDGTQQRRLTFDAGQDNRPSFSPDGRRIVFQSNRYAGQYDIMLMNADGTNQVHVTTSSVNDVWPCFSPDGTRVAFTSARGGGDNEICTTGLAGEQTVPVRRLTENFNDDSWPSWAITATSGNSLGGDPPGGNSLAAPHSLARATDESAPGLSSLSAEASSATLTLRFDGALDAEAASDFTVTVNDRAVAVQSVAVSGDTVSLRLADGALRSGNSVTVQWNGGAATALVP